ncbi:SORTING NEXIN-16 [Salix viminalis]|uniref:SORTING NEXIN-16 n=1 Tax=Salix viminalis TaxID=40686 RepID=A0A9Q0QJS3_SALVM|nr:SORTING NEXIN-16 [Salix viminalis]
MKAMETVHDLIEEAKLRTVWWCLCIFSVTYFLSYSSSSMWMNLPISILIVSALRILSNEVEFSWKVLVEAAIDGFIDKILKDFVVDLWYSEITPDREAPELIRSVIMDALGEVSGRAKEINLVNLLTRDLVDLIGDHLDLFRRNQAAIGADSEYKVLQRLIGGVLAIVLRPREAQCPLVRTISREIITCLIMQPLMNLASPVYINEVLELVLLFIKDDSPKDNVGDQPAESVHNADSTLRKDPSVNSQRTEIVDNKRDYQGTDKTLSKTADRGEMYLDYDSQLDHIQPHPAEWARMLEVATQRRTEVLAPENLENMWTKGRNYKTKEKKKVKAGVQQSMAKSLVTSTATDSNLGKDMLRNTNVIFKEMDEKAIGRLTPRLSLDTLTSHENKDGRQSTQDGSQELSFEGAHVVGELENACNLSLNEKRGGLKRSNSTSALKDLLDKKNAFIGDGRGSIISEFYSPDFHRSADQAIKVSNMVVTSEGARSPKLKCRVIGAYFEKLGSKSFAVYSIAVTDTENRTWFVKRRYRNFERLHKHLKEIPNYTLHLPPKRIFSSSTEDAFVHQRCIQLDKYIQDLLSIANVAEQHEVWDFLSASSKNYSFAKSSAVMRTLTVNVDDAVDDIVRQFKDVSDGFMRKAVDSTSPLDKTNSSIYNSNLSWHLDDVNKHVSRRDALETANSYSETEKCHNQGGHDQKGVESTAEADGCHSDNELNAKGIPLVNEHDGGSRTLGLEKKPVLEEKSEQINNGVFSVANPAVASSHMDDPIGMPPEWNPSNVSVPLLNLVDKVFQLKRRGWLRRQVFWISKQILQLIMEDAIDDWLLRQIYWLRSEDTIAFGIQWVQDILWPNGMFFTTARVAQSKVDDDQLNLIPFQISQLSGSKVSNKGSFEEQLEAACRASDIKKMLFDGAPATLVSLIGNKQYKRCARDIFNFTQSTICVKQLAYGILELLVLSVFPELRDLLLGLNEKMRAPPA